MIKLLNKITNLLLSDFGINSFTGLVDTLIGWKYKITTLYLFSGALSGVFVYLEDVSNVHVYRPFLGLELLWVCSLLDVMLGITVTLENKEAIDPKRMVRAGVRALFQTCLVAIVFNLMKVYPFLVQKWMVSSLLLLFTSSVFWSCVVNAYKLGYIKEDEYKFLQSIINLKTLITKLKNGINRGKP